MSSSSETNPNTSQEKSPIEATSSSLPGSNAELTENIEVIPQSVDEGRLSVFGVANRLLAKARLHRRSAEELEVTAAIRRESADALLVRREHKPHLRPSTISERRNQRRNEKIKNEEGERHLSNVRLKGLYGNSLDPNSTEASAVVKQSRKERKSLAKARRNLVTNNNAIEEAAQELRERAAGQDKKGVKIQSKIDRRRSPGAVVSVAPITPNSVPKGPEKPNSSIKATLFRQPYIDNEAIQQLTDEERAALINGTEGKRITNMLAPELLAGLSEGQKQLLYLTAEIRLRARLQGHEEHIKSVEKRQAAALEALGARRRRGRTDQETSDEKVDSTPVTIEDVDPKYYDLYEMESIRQLDQDIADEIIVRKNEMLRGTGRSSLPKKVFTKLGNDVRNELAEEHLRFMLEELELDGYSSEAVRYFGQLLNQARNERQAKEAEERRQREERERNRYR